MKGNIRERQPGVFQLTVFVGRSPTGRQQFRYRTIHGGKRDAQREMTKFLRELQDGTGIEATNETVAQFLERWLRDYAKPNVSPRTYENYAELIRRHIVPELGSRKLDKLQAVHLQAFYARKHESGRIDGTGGLSAQTVKHLHSILHEALHYAVKWQVLPRNPAEYVDPPKREKQQLHVIDEAATLRLLAIAEPTWMWVPVLLAITTGMRRGEILALRWDDVDLDAQVATVQRSLEVTKAGGLRMKETKTGRSRRVDLAPYTVQALRAHKGAQSLHRISAGADYQNQNLVCARADGTPIPPNSVTQAFQDVRKKAGFTLRFHDLRHSHVSQLIRQGAPINVISSRIGHAGSAITMDVYGHLFPGMGRDAADRFEAGLRQAQSDEKDAV